MKCSGKSQTPHCALLSHPSGYSVMGILFITVKQKNHPGCVKSSKKKKKKSLSKLKFKNKIKCFDRETSGNN